MDEYIKREDALMALTLHDCDNTGAKMMITDIPASDVVAVVRCKDCTLHGWCITEDHFRFAGVENPYCCVGKRREP